MLRCVPLCVVLLVLACSPAALAQTKKSPSVAERFKSLFTRAEKKPAAKAPLDRPMPPAKKSSEKAEGRPISVTTRSGSLRRPGPEAPMPFEPAATPTFAPAENSFAGQPPRMLETDSVSAKKLPEAGRRSRKGPIRDSGVRPAGFETESKPEKKTMLSWFRGLWPRKDKSPASHPAPSPVRPNATGSMGKSAANQGSSIDPRRVYRAPVPETEQDPKVKAADFSETGVPGSGVIRRGVGSSY